MSRLQEIQFELMEMSSFNSFDGKFTVEQLKAHPEWWTGAMWGRFEYSPLIPLRDMDNDNSWNADTLYIMVNPAFKAEMVKLMHDCGADEIDFESVERMSSLMGSYGPGDKKAESNLLRVWWD